MPRRTVVKAAAWSVPVIASTVAAPAFAASGCAPGSASFSVPSPTQASGGVQNWTVPTGVASVSFAVAGGAGGGFDATPGGKGALTTGTLAVTPGDVLTIYVGQGGRGGALQDTGGGGYGSGGSTTLSSSPVYWDLGGGGGGGSAIVLNGTPLVVAGGGGGGGSMGWAYSTRSGGVGGNAGANGGALTAGPVVAGGGQASGAGGVASGSYQQTTPGLAASGRNGANGVVAGRLGADGVSMEYVGSGAGGGGYTGGGSGAIAYRNIASPLAHENVAGAGAGGSSYLAPGVAGTVNNSGGAAPKSSVRSPGYVTLTWTC
ncbi:glycine-rich protein [Microbacterium sp. NPDC056052]|uniref:glycine-rich protein n=1 Tax=Microbacterium sp. NPDC056052 TaxID=3345695 RepID=UPI0035DD8E0D